MTDQSTLDYLNDHGFDLSSEDLADSLAITDYDEAIVGLTDDNILVYDYDLLVSLTIRADAPDPEHPTDDDILSAIEYVDYNIVRSIGYLGPGAPIIIYPVHDEEFPAPSSPPSSS